MSHASQQRDAPVGARKSQRVVDVEVTEITPDGYGGGLSEGRAIRVKGARPGDYLRARVVRRRRGTWWTLPEQWVRAAPRPAEPACGAFLRCGGCSLQQLDAEEQLAFKQASLLAHLADRGVEPEELSAPVRGPLLGYRRKARLGGRYLRDKGEFLLGFRESFGSRVARLERCPVLAAPLGDLLGALKMTLGELAVRADVPQVEVSVGDGEATVALRHLTPLPESDRAALASFGARHHIQILLQSAGYESLVRLDGGPERPLGYRLDEFGVHIEFTTSDFVQINAKLNERLVAAAVALLRPGRGQRIGDLFCGLGNFTLPLARSGARVLGVEGSAQMVHRAQANATRNGLATTCAFTQADLYGPTVPALDEALDAALVDPPRSGCGTALELLATPTLGRLVYVSCHPESFAADAARLLAMGFDLKRLKLFDMFPHTTHVESLALFERR